MDAMGVGSHLVSEDCRTPRSAPSDDLRRLYFDSLVYTPGGLEALVAAGADQVLLGTDFPFDMGIDDPLARLDAAASLTPDERAGIAGATVARLLAICFP
jgi:aminocarboxymuconate-semialdehyde decarboxylase